MLITLGKVKSQDIVSAAETAKLIKNDNVVIVSTRTAADYKKVHITGAVHINHSELYKDGPVKNMLNTPQEIASTEFQKYRPYMDQTPPKYAGLRASYQYEIDREYWCYMCNIICS